MTLAILLQHYFPYGGLQRDALRLARAAITAGHQPTLIISSLDGELPDDLEVIITASGGATNHSKLHRFSIDCQPLIKGQRFDVSIAFSRIPGATAHFCGDPCYREKFSSSKPSFLRLLPRYRFYLSQEEALFGPNSETHLFFLAASEIPAFEKHYTITPSRHSVLPPWTKPSTCLPETELSNFRKGLLRTHKIQADAKILLFVGSDFRRKGLDRIIQAISNIERADIHLIICGQDDFEDYQKLGQALNITDRIHFIGPTEDIPKFMAICDLLAHPARQETAGMVLLEALTAHLPVICTDICGYATHVVDAGCPTIPSDFQTEDLQCAILKILDNPTPFKTQIADWSHTQQNRMNAAETILSKLETLSS